MANQSELDNTYMACAAAHAALSKAVRAKVGAALVTPSGVILGGCNGLSSGGGNTLEVKEYLQEGAGSWLDVEQILKDYPFTDLMGRYKLITKQEVIHAELNCILKAAEQGVSVKDSTLYVTMAPCLVCAEMLLQIKIKRVVFRDSYRCTKGVDKLKSKGVELVQIGK